MNQHHLARWNYNGASQLMYTYPGRSSNIKPCIDIASARLASPTKKTSEWTTIPSTNSTQPPRLAHDHVNNHSSPQTPWPQRLPPQNRALSLHRRHNLRRLPPTSRHPPNPHPPRPQQSSTPAPWLSQTRPPYNQQPRRRVLEEICCRHIREQKRNPMDGQELVDLSRQGLQGRGAEPGHDYGDGHGIR